MKNKIVGIFVMMLLIVTNVLPVTGDIDVDQYEGNEQVDQEDCLPCSAYKMHFPQMPDEDGWAVSATYVDEYQSGVRLADDWMCNESGPVSNIRFWGAWKKGLEGVIDYFWVCIHEDIPADQSPTGYSMPGEILWWRLIFNWEEIPIEGSWQGWYCVESETWEYNDHADYYQYDIINITRPFIQEKGTIYWLSIQANVLYEEPDQPVWGWKSSDDHWNDDAVWTSENDWTELYEPANFTQSLDLAYVVFSEIVESLKIDAIFQPVQVVYQDDPLWGNSLKGGPCSIDAELDMVAGKNTLLFGYPYDKRGVIKVRVCNNLDDEPVVDFVWKIDPYDKEIHRIKNQKLKRGSHVYEFAAPIPPEPFQWELKDPDPDNVVGCVKLELDPDVTLDKPSICNCQKVVVIVNINKTHNLSVLFVPFTFSEGPEIPSFIYPYYYDYFNDWLQNKLQPWWQGIFPVRDESSKKFVKLVRTHFKLKQNVKIFADAGGFKIVKNLDDYNGLSENEKWLVRKQMYHLSWISSIIKGKYDRVVFMVHPDVLKIGKYNNLGLSYPYRDYNRGVLVDWSTYDTISTAVHEIGHTYGLKDDYIWNDTEEDFDYYGNKSFGYWVNKGIDITMEYGAFDIMGAIYQFWGPNYYQWIKKPNYEDLLEEFSKIKDPEVLSISGLIDIDDNITLNPWYKLEEGTIDLNWGLLGNYLIKAYDIGGNLINETGFDVDFIVNMDYIGQQPVNVTFFGFRLEWIDGIQRVDIVNATNNYVLASRTVTPNTPQISITSPTQGETIKPGPYEIKWDASDLDGDTLTYQVFITNNSGETWFPIVLALENDTWIANFTDISKGSYQLNVLVTDGWNVNEDSVSFEIKKVRDKNSMIPYVVSQFFSFLFKHFPWLERLFSIFPELLNLH